MPSVPAPLHPRVLEELERLAAADALGRSQQLVRLLRHLVHHHLAGDEYALRETAIALEVFRRDPATYDPQGDPIVRVTTGRLRERLAAHYKAAGAGALSIVLPKGRYVPKYVVAGRAASAAIGVAVLHTRNATGDARLDAFCAALSDRLADHLARAGVLRVIACASGDGAVERGGDAVAIGTALDVAWLLESSVSLDPSDDPGRGLRIAVRLVGTADGSLRWTDARLAGERNRHAMADRLIDAVVIHACDTLPGDSSRASSAPHSSLPPTHRVAVDAARFLLLQRTIAATDEAIVLAERVVLAHPRSATGWAALSAALCSRMTFQDRRVEPLAVRAREAAEHALAIDPNETVALRTKAIIVGRYEWKVTEAIGLFERALRIVPHYTSARLNYGDLLIIQGEYERALAEVNLALVYDPLSSSVRLARAFALGVLGRFEEARAEWSILRATGEASFWVFTGPARLEVLAGQAQAAQTMCDDALRRFPELPEPLFVAAYVAAARGRRALAMELDGALVERFAHYSPTNRALVPAMLHDKAGTLARLDEAIAARDIAFLYTAISPEFAWLASDADFLRRLSAAGVTSWKGRVRVPQA